jgi:hypothetical protein
MVEIIVLALICASPFLLSMMYWREYMPNRKKPVFPTFVGGEIEAKNVKRFTHHDLYF